MAGLIPQSFIDELLSRSDIVDVIDKRVRLRKTGKNYSALCPFHKEKSPSFSVEPDKQFYYCFGCGAGGNALGFLMAHENMDFPEAVEALASEHGLDVPREESGQHRQRREENQPLLDALQLADRYYQQQLRQHPQRERAVQYLKGRGLTGAVAKQFGIGFAPPGWENLLQAGLEQKLSREVMEKAGLLIKRDAERMQANRDSHYDRFRDRITFPIRDSRGRCIAFGGRVLGEDKPKYLNSPETPVYHKGQELYGLYEARKSGKKLERMLVVEGYMDVVALAQHGIHYAVATLGTATSENHLQRLFRVVPEVIFCFDGDEAGRTAAWRALQTCLPQMQEGRQMRFLFLPEGEDPDTLVREQGQKGFERLMGGAASLSDYLFDKLTEGLDTDSIDDRALLVSRALPVIGQLPDSIYRQLVLDRLAELSGTQRSSLEQKMGGTQARPAAPPPEAGPPDDHPAAASGMPATRPTNTTQRESASAERARTRVQKPTSLLAMELLLYQPALALDIKQDLSPLEDLGDEYTKLLLELIELVKNNPTTTTYTMLGHCYGTQPGARLTQLLKSETITPAIGIGEEFHYLIDRLLKQVEKQRFRQKLMEQIRPRLRSSGQQSENQ